MTTLNNCRGKILLSNTISNLLNNNKVFFDIAENFPYISSNSNLKSINSNIDNSDFENLKCTVKSKVISEDKTKSNNFVLPNRFSCLNSYNLKIVLILSKKWFTILCHQTNQIPQKTWLILSTRKNIQKNLLEIKLRHQNTWQYPLLTVTRNIQKNLLETAELRWTNPTLLQLILLEIPQSKKFLLTNYQYNLEVNTMLQLDWLVEPKHSVWKITSNRPRNLPQNK